MSSSPRFELGEWWFARSRHKRELLALSSIAIGAARFGRCRRTTMNKTHTKTTITTFSLPFLATFAACADPVDTASTEQALVTPAAPYRHDTPYSIVPDLGVRGMVSEPAPTATDASSIHEATFSNGRDSNTPGATTASTWYPQAAGDAFAQFESAPAFTTDLAGAVAAANPELAQLTDLSG